MNVIKSFFKFLLGVCMLAFAFLVSAVGGWFLRYGIWILCFIWSLFKGEGAIINWIGNHDAAMWVICSIPIVPLLIIG